jgi:hypothetical protein
MIGAEGIVNFHNSHCIRDCSTAHERCIKGREILESCAGRGLTKNTKYFGNLIKVINWGMDVMFHPIDTPQIACNSGQQNEMNRVYEPMLDTISLLNESMMIICPKDFRFPQSHVAYHTRHS